MWINESKADQYYCPHSVEMCKGQKCMAWRWGFINQITDAKYTGQSYSAQEVGVSEGKYPEGTRFRARRGYCGLGGPPSN